MFHTAVYYRNAPTMYLCHIVVDVARHEIKLGVAVRARMDVNAPACPIKLKVQTVMVVICSVLVYVAANEGDLATLDTNATTQDLDLWVVSWARVMATSDIDTLEGHRHERAALESQTANRHDGLAAQYAPAIEDCLPCCVCPDFDVLVNVESGRGNQVPAVCEQELALVHGVAERCCQIDAALRGIRVARHRVRWPRGRWR